jgi:pyruvate/2-oxoglutarate/acetoin dehydrogenase E1 component
MKYKEELTKAMEWLGQKKNTIFLGQAVEFPGTAMTQTLKKINKKKILEFPVAEDFQLGFSIGLSLNGLVPISIYPRWNFLILATNQLVNHLDKLNKMSSEILTNKVIIRTSVGSERPLNPQHQHVGNFTKAYQKMLSNVEIIELKNANQILKSYQKAYNRKDKKSTILVEYGDYINEK